MWRRKLCKVWSDAEQGAEVEWIGKGRQAERDRERARGRASTGIDKWAAN